MEVRERQAGDLVNLVPLFERVHTLDNYPVFLPDGDISRFLSNPAPIAAWVAFRTGQLVGHVALHDTTSRPAMQLAEDHVTNGGQPAYVARLVVDPGSRGHGIGRQLLNHARRAATERERSPYLDVVDLPGAAPAIALYRHAEWEEIGRVKFDLAGDHVEELVFCGRGATGAELGL